MFERHYRLERKSLRLAIAIILVSSIGGLIEIAPLFTIDETVETDPNMSGSSILVVLNALRLTAKKGPDDKLASVDNAGEEPIAWGVKVAG